MEVLKTICDILSTGLQIDPKQVWIYNQKIDIPADKKLYVVCKISEEKAFGVNLNYDGKGEGLKENTIINLRSIVSIETFSYGLLAYTRRYDILSAMRSTYSLQKQEALNFNISRAPLVFVEATFAAPTAKLYSFHYQYAVTHIHNSGQKEVDYYDNNFDPDIVVNKE